MSREGDVNAAVGTARQKPTKLWLENMPCKYASTQPMALLCPGRAARYVQRQSLDRT